MSWRKSHHWLLVAILLMTGIAAAAPAHAAVVPNACTDPTSFPGGDGSAANPFEVATADDLVQVADPTCMSFSFRQIRDIDLSGVVWSEIGTWVPLNPFTGSYDGAGYLIRNLEFNDQSDPGGNQVGLFGRVEGATLTDIHLVDASVTGWDAVGSLVGVANNTVITDCDSTDVTVVGEGGGFDTVGGFAGVIETNSRVTDSWATGQVDGVSRVGGFVGANLDGSTISDSTSDVEVAGTQWVGGFAGQNDASVVDVSAAGGVIGGLLTGGLVGVSQGTIVRGRSTGEVIGTTFVGGLAGLTQGTVTSSQAEGDVTGDSYVGGLVGKAQFGAVVSDSTASGSVTATLDSAGGLIGAASEAGTVIRRSWSSGSVSAVTGTVGGFIGYGIVGVRIADSFATGSVTGPGAAGFAGRLDAGASIIRSYAVGAVAASDGDGFAHDAVGTVRHSFFDRQTTGKDSGPGRGLITSRMTTLEPFEQAGWGIVQGWSASGPPAHVWGICSTVNEGYPYLLWMHDADPCPRAPTVDPVTPGPALTGIPYRVRITAHGYPEPTFAVHSGALPAGLDLDPDTGVISGIPTTVGTFTIVVRVGNSVGHVDTPTLVIAVDDLVPRAPRSLTLLAAVAPGAVVVQTEAAVLPSRTHAVDARRALHTRSTGPFGRIATTRLASRDPSGPVHLEHAGRTCILTPGGSLRVDATGFLPGATIAVYADPGAVGGRSARSLRTWGRLTADAAGRVTGSVDVPAGVTSGAHVIQMVGATDRNALRAVSVGVLVDRAPRAVRDLTATRIRTGAADLTWQEPRGLQVAARSVVELRVPGASFVRVSTGSAYDLTRAQVTGLQAGCAYDVRVRVVSPLGAGPWTEVRIPGARGRMAPAGDVTCRVTG